VKVVCALVVLMSCLAGPCLAKSPDRPAFDCDRRPLLVRNVDIWSAGGIDRRRDLLVADGRIQRISPGGKLKAPQGARVVDGHGRLMLPGFVDAHVHFVFPGPVGDRKGDPSADALVFGRQLLASGITSARVHLDTLAHAKLLQELARAECAPMPHLQVSGPAFIPGTGTGDQGPVWDVTGADDAGTKVRRSHEQGFQWIALHESHKFSPEARAAIVDTARQLGMRILGSGYTQEELASSLAIRPDTIDYLDVSSKPGYDPGLLDLAHQQKQLTWVARLGIHERYRAYQENPALIDAPLNYEFFDMATAEALRQGVRASIADRNSEHAKRMDGAWPTMHRKFEQLRTSGIPLAMGTDVGSPGQFHRDAIWWEIRSWVKHGATADEAIAAATTGGARIVGTPGGGQIREGGAADFLLCPADVTSLRAGVERECKVTRAGVTL